MQRRDPLAQALFGLGCAAIIGAPVIAVAASCASVDSRSAPQAPHSSTAAPSAQPPVSASHRSAQSPKEGSPPPTAQFIA